MSENDFHNRAMKDMREAEELIHQNHKIIHWVEWTIIIRLVSAIVHALWGIVEVIHYASHPEDRS